jgi:hypothetical protein
MGGCPGPTAPHLWQHWRQGNAAVAALRWRVKDERVVPDKLGRTSRGAGVCVDARSTITVSFKGGVDRTTK